MSDVEAAEADALVQGMSPEAAASVAAATAAEYRSAVAAAAGAAAAERGAAILDGLEEFTEPRQAPQTRPNTQGAGAAAVDKLRAAGFLEIDIQSFVTRQRKLLAEGGFSEIEIDQYFGKPPIEDKPLRSWAEEVVDTALDELIAPDIGGERPDVMDLLDKAIESGYQQSVTGLALRNKLPDVKLPPDVGLLPGIVSQLSTLIGDVPSMIVGAVGGAGYGTTVAGPGLGTLAGAGAGAFALPAAMREAYMQELQNGSVKSFQEFFERQGAIFLAATKGAVTGAATVTAGGLQTGFVRTVGAELTTMVTVGAGLEGKVPSGRDFVEGAVLLFGLKGTVKLATHGQTRKQRQQDRMVKVLQNIYARTGKTPQEILRDIEVDPTILEDIISAQSKNGRQIPRAYEHLTVKEPPPKVQPTAEEKALAAKEKKREAEAKTDGEVPQAKGDLPPALEVGTRAPEQTVAEVRADIKKAEQRIAAFRARKQARERKRRQALSKDARFKEDVSNLATAVLRSVNVGGRDRVGFSFSRLYEQTIDDLYPIAILVRKLANGEKIDAHLDPYKAARFSPAAAAKANLFLDFEVRRFGSTEVVGPGLRQIMRPLRGRIREFRAYATARRALELNERGISVGVDLAKAAELVKLAGPEFATAFRLTVEFQNNVLAYLRDSGVLSDITFNKILKANKDYIPLFRLFDTKTSPGLGTGLRTRDPLRKIKGSERDIIDPLESIVKNTYLYIQLAERNTVGVKMVELAESHGGTGVGSLVRKVEAPTKPIKASKSELAKVAEDAKAEFGIEFTLEELTLFRADTLRPTNTQIVVFRKGKREIYEVGPDVGRAMNGMDSQSANLFLLMLSVPAKTLRAGAILNPEFFVKNLERDTVAATVFSTAGFRPVFDTILGGLSLITKDTAFRDWMMSGGANATLVSLDRRYLQHSLRAFTKESGLFERGINVARSPLEILRIASELVENSTRLGAFKRKTRGERRGDPRRRDPKSIAEGGFESREVTQDFARMGSSMRALNMISAFLGARVGGYDRLIRAFLDNPVRSTALATATITVPSILLWLRNHDDPRYIKLPPWQKHAFWIILTDEHIYRIPKPFTLGLVFGTFPEILLDAFLKDNPDSHTDIVKALSDAAATDIGGLSTLLPTAVTPIIESSANYSFFRDMPLIPSRLERLLPQEQYTPYTTQLARALGQLTGPTIGLSPLEIENYVRQWSGGLGTKALHIADKVLREAGVVPDPPRADDTLADMPVVRAFMIRDPSPNTQQINEFYEKTEELERIMNTYIKMLHEGRVLEADQILRGKTPLDIAFLQDARRTVSEQAALARLIDADPTMPGAQKRQLIDKVYRNMQAIAVANLATLNLLTTTP